MVYGPAFKIKTFFFMGKMIISAVAALVVVTQETTNKDSVYKAMVCEY